MYDTIIIGGGPAGLSAAIYAARREMKTLLIAKNPGGQMMWASAIENYPGFASIRAAELVMKMQEQAKNSGAEIKIAEVKEIKKTAEDDFEVATDKEKFSAKTVIVAIGAAHRRLGVPGEEELGGRGVAYCANCDGPLFRNKTVAVVGGGNSALDSAEVLSKIAAKVYLVHQFETFQAFEALEKKVRAASNIEIILGVKVEAVLGDKKVSALKIRRAADDTVSEIAVDGVFVEIGFEVRTEMVAELAKRNERQEIITSEKGETSLPGLFAAGDCADTAFKQITIASGSGTTAALGAYQYIQLKEGNIGKLLK